MQDATEIRTVEVIHWSWSAVRSALPRWLGPGLVLGLVLGLIGGLAAGLRFVRSFVLNAGLLDALLAALHSGGRACLQHMVLRLRLVRNGVAPWGYVEFLDYAAERIFLRKIGGGYMFIHWQLQEYFASLHTAPHDATHRHASPRS